MAQKKSKSHSSLSLWECPSGSWWSAEFLLVSHMKMLSLSFTAEHLYPWPPSRILLYLLAVCTGRFCWHKWVYALDKYAFWILVVLLCWMCSATFIALNAEQTFSSNMNPAQINLPPRVVHFSFYLLFKWASLLPDNVNFFTWNQAVLFHWLYQFRI